MQSRGSRIIKTILSKTTKPLVLVLFVFTLLASTPSITNAQLEPADIQNKYNPYLSLFSQNATVLSTPAAGNLIKDLTNNNVTGLKLNIKFSFTPSSTASNEELWKYIKNDSAFTNPVSEDTFVIRLCNTANKAQCFIQQIPYDDNADSSGTNFAHISRKDLSNNFAPGNELKDFSILGNSGPSALLDNARHTYARVIDNDKNEGTIGSYNGKLKLNSSTMEATLWYCAANNGTFTGQNAYQTIGHGFNDTIATFGTLCGGNSYFRIGAPLFISIPAATDSAAIATGTNTQQASATTSDGSTTNLPSCGVIPGQQGTIVGCLAQLVYYGIYIPISWIAGLFGSLFDFFIGYSVSDESYRYSFAVTGWKLVRDIANIMFIIILIYTGFAAVFDFGGKGGSTLKRVVPFLIINALIINFSLFATRTVIDISNITARVFYSRMIVCDGPCGANVPGTNIPENVKRGLGGHWPLSEKIVSAFDPQKMFKTSVLESKESAPNSQGNRLTNTTAAGQIVEQTKGFGTTSAEYAAYYALVSLLAAGIMLFVGIMFFKVMFMFLGRVIGLYVAMIFSPFAFITLNGGGGFFSIKGFEWNTWSKDLFNYAALAPIFTFFLYIIYSFINTDMVAQIGLKDATGGFFGTLLTIAVPMLLIYVLIDYGAKLAAKYAGAFGMMAQNTLSKAVGLAGGAALGLASGGLAMAGTGLGARAGKALGNTRVGAWAANNADNNRAARFFNNTLSKTQTGSWDFRNTKLNSLVNKGVTQVTGGVKLDDRVTNRLGLSTSNFTGGAIAQQKKREEEIKKSFETKIQYSHLSDDRAKELWERRQNKKASELAMQEHALATDTEYKTATDTVKAQKAELEARRKEIKDAKNRLSTERSTLTTVEKATLNTSIDEAQKKVIEAQKALVDAKTTQSARLAFVKDSTDKDGAEYQSKVKDAKDKQKADDTKTYGSIEKTSEFTNAMRRDYVEDKRNNSLWMKDGEQRAGLWGIPLGGAGAGVLAAGLSAVSGGVGAAFGSVIANRIKFEQEAFDAATQSYMKNYGKKKGKDSKAEQLTDKIKSYEEIIKKGVTDRLKAEDAEKVKNDPNYTPRTEDQLKEEVKKMDSDVKDSHMKEYIAEKEAELTVAEAAFKNAEESYRRNPNSDALKDALKKASKDRKQAKDVLSKAENVWKDKEKAEADLEKENEKNNPKP